MANCLRRNPDAYTEPGVGGGFGGGSLTIQDSNFTNNNVIKGSGAGNGLDGTAKGGAIFLHNVDLNIDVTGANIATIEDDIADNSSGTGGLASALNKSGTGTLVLQGINTYAGDTNLSDGILSINGTVAGDVNISGGMLKGNGTIGGTVHNNGGTLAAGNSIGTATYGSLNHSSGTVEVEIEPGGNTPGVHNDWYQITGAAVINGGTVSVKAAPGVYSAPTQYTFLTAGGGVSGRTTKQRTGNAIDSP